MKRYAAALVVVCVLAWLPGFAQAVDRRALFSRGQFLAQADAAQVAPPPSLTGDEIVAYAIRAFNGGIPFVYTDDDGRRREIRYQFPEPVSFSKLINAGFAGVRTLLQERGCAIKLTDIISDVDAVSKYKFQRDGILAFCQVTKLEFETAAMHAMIASLDDGHTNFLDQEMLRRVRDQRAGQPFAGIGVTLVCVEKLYYILDVVKDGPASQGGILPFDRLDSVGGQQVGCETPEAANATFGLIRGQAGASVAIVVARPPLGDLLSFTITRRFIQPSPLSYKIIPGTCFGLLKISTFFYGSDDQAELLGQKILDALTSLMRENACGLMLDLRYNGGGRVISVGALLDMMLPPGTVILRGKTRTAQGPFVTEGPQILPSSLPIAVLINSGSASASEIAASALRENHRLSVLVGTKSAGALDAAVLLMLPQGTALQLTIMRLWTGKGVRVDKAGVTPDVVVELTRQDLDQGRDGQFEAALRELLRLRP